ncbi:hypothetical protein [Aeromicrobium sp. NPDC092404]|uniref:hypothetical protein n=1 Tax=Aeromicrobium sp. NPDC092404 TaxID=3154976 RepID=UPI00341D805E
MPYSAEKPITPPPSEELRQRIPGWGSDLDPKDRPSFPQERLDPGTTGAHWDVPEQQEGVDRRERSIEHPRVTPAFGTSVPLRGVSGAIRRLAYVSFSEARAAHWLLLLAGDRVDVAESHARALLSGRPTAPGTASGLRSELTHHGWSSRRGHGRADVKHQWLDPVVVAGPLLLAGVAATRVVRRLGRNRS